MKITIIAAALSAALAAGATWELTRSTVGAEWSAKYAALEQRYAEQGRELAEDSQALAEALRAEEGERQARVDKAAAVLALEGDIARKNERIALLEAAQYEPPATACNCDLNADWVSRYNAAARLSHPAQTGADPHAAGRAANRARSAKDALNVTAWNFADCAKWRRALVGWQEYYASLPEHK